LLEEKQCLLENKRALKPLQENIFCPLPSLSCGLDELQVKNTKAKKHLLKEQITTKT